MRNLFKKNNNTLNYALVGTLFGLIFPIIATVIRVYDSNLSFGIPAIISVQSSDTLLWIIDTAPLFLGLFAARDQPGVFALNWRSGGPRP